MLVGNIYYDYLVQTALCASLRVPKYRIRFQDVHLLVILLVHVFSD